MRKISFAPMEGITGYIYRNAHHACFGGITGYYTPFLATHQKRKLKGREIADVLPENNPDIEVIPQILSNNSEDFMVVARDLKAMGYRHVNLNLGCPSGTVVSKHKGSGFLADREALTAFLIETTNALEQIDMELSVKTRIGKDSPAEFEELLQIFNQVKLKELIVHPRIQKDFYNNSPNLECFELAMRESRNPLCYNGDLADIHKCNAFWAKYPQQEHIMIGRGLLRNPALAQQLTGDGTLTRQQLQIFHDMILEKYQNCLFGDTPVLFKMKELWFYMLPIFTNPEKYDKKIKKSQSISEYKTVISAIFRDEMINGS